MGHLPCFLRAIERLLSKRSHYTSASSKSAAQNRSQLDAKNDRPRFEIPMSSNYPRVVNYLYAVEARSCRATTSKPSSVALPIIAQTLILSLHLDASPGSPNSATPAQSQREEKLQVQF